MKRTFFATLAAALCILFAGAAQAAILFLSNTDGEEAPVRHGAAYLARTAQSMGMSVVDARNADPRGNNPVVILDVAHGNRRLKAIIEDAGLQIPETPESFVLYSKPPFIYAAGTDAVGAMYAAYEIAERLQMAENPAFLASSVPSGAHTPAMEIRAVNPFFHTDAFNDPESWYYDEKFWETYLDELSYDRYNLLDIHAMYELISTFFPNCYLYMLKSDKFPDVGIDAAQAAKNLETFKKIVAMAKERGIRTSLMSYHASWRLTSADKEDMEPSTRDLADYTAEMATKMIDSVPDLWMLGFRIGESGRPEEFFRDSYIRGVNNATRRVNLFTRSWLANPFHTRSIADAYPGRFYIEIKYNGEQLGLPYHAMTSNRKGAAPSYTWEDYTNQPRNYKILWQIRSNGTHRLFRWGDPEFASRTMKSVRFGKGAGFSMEPMTSYYPMTDHFHKDPSQFDYFTWDHQRNWFWYMVWGRMAYDPNTPETVWLNRFTQRFGKAAAADVYDTVVHMSRIVPLIYSYRCIGPDHRNMAPEYETGGSLFDFMNNTPLDFHSIRAIDEFVRWTLFDGALRDSKLGPFETADLLERHAARAAAAAERAKSVLDSEKNSEFRDLLIELDCLSALAHYYSNKIRAATHFGFFMQTNDLADLAKAREFTAKAHESWDKLSETGETHYGQILDTLRIRRFVDKPTFTWRELQPSLQKDIEEMDKALELALAGTEPAIRHHPIYRAPAGEYLRITASVLRIGAKPVLHYRPAGGGAPWIEKAMKPVDFENLFEYYIPKEHATGQIEYYIDAQKGDLKARYPSGKPLKRAAGQFDIEDYLYNDAKNITNELKRIDKMEKQKYVTVQFMEDTARPVVTLQDVEVLDFGATARITVKVRDDSALKEVKIAYKPLPTQYPWIEKDMEPAGDAVYRIDLPLTHEGIMYNIKAADAWHNATAWPWLLEETPYRWIDAWDPAANPYDSRKVRIEPDLYWGHK